MLEPFVVGIPEGGACVSKLTLLKLLLVDAIGDGIRKAETLSIKMLVFFFFSDNVWLQTHRIGYLNALFQIAIHFKNKQKECHFLVTFSLFLSSLTN